MKKTTLLKTLLMAVGLCMGGSAWAGTTKTITLYPTGDTDPTKAAAWKCQFDPTEGDGYISFAHSGSGQREAYLKFYNTGNDIYAGYDTYTVSFDFWTHRGWHHQSDKEATPQVAFYAEGATVGNGTNNFTGRNTTTKNYLMLWSNTISSLDVRTMYVNGSDTENFTTPRDTWARATITVTKSTGNVVYSVKSLDGNTAYLPEGSYTATGDGTSANCQGIYFSFGRLSGQEVRVNNVKVTTVIEVDEVTDPSASVSSVNTTSGERTLAVTDGVSDNDGSVTTYWSASTELTESNYSSAGTAVVSNTITTTSDVVYLISISTKGGNSNCVTYNVADNVRLKAPSVALKSVTHNDGTLESPVFTINATANTDVVGTPTSTLYYTFTPNGGSESVRTAISDGGTYSPTAYGTLKVYATATGYTENVYSIPVSDYYSSDYSTDYTAYTENPFGSSETTSGEWWTGATAYKSTASKPTTLGRLRFANNTVTHLVIGYGVGRPGNTCNVQIRNNKLGNIQTLTIKNNNKSGVTSGTFYHDDLGTSGNGEDTDLTSSYYVPSYNTVAKHNCYVPAENPAIAAAIADCKTYETSDAFATYIDGVYATGSLTTAAEVYAAHTAWQIAQAKASGSTDLTKLIRNAAVADGTDWGGSSINHGEQYTGAPDEYYLDKWNGTINTNQIIYGVPAGTYKIKAATRSAANTSGTLYVNDGISDIAKVNQITSVGNTGGDLGNGWSWSEMTFTLTETKNLQVGFWADASSSKWAGCDDWHMELLGVTVTVGKNGYTTFASPYALDLTDENRPEGLKAYKATLSGSNLSFQQLHQTVYAGTGLLLLGETNDGTYNIPVVESGDGVETALTGVLTPTAKQSNESGDYYFVMRKANSAEDALTFAPITTDHEVTIPAGKVYITVPSSAFTGGARAIAVSFDDDETTGIDNLTPALSEGEEVVYNLNGQRIDKPAKGLYIVNGKKVLVK